MASNIQVTFQTTFSFNIIHIYLFEGFAFKSVNEDVAPQRLKCHVEICHVDTENSPCSTGCYGVSLQYERMHYKSSRWFRVWDDSGSGAIKDGSFWKILDDDHTYSRSGFYPLGDAVCLGHGIEGVYPCKDLIRVKDVSSENILTQEGFSIIKGTVDSSVICRF